MACRGCDYRDNLIQELKKSLTEAEKSSLHWYNKWFEVSQELHTIKKEITPLDWLRLLSDKPSTKELTLSELSSYKDHMLFTFSFLTILLNMFITLSHTRIEKSPNTSNNWKLWSNLYKSFIIDTYIRSRAPKSVRRTNFLLSTFCLLAGVNTSVWNLLQKLRILCAQSTVKN